MVLEVRLTRAARIGRILNWLTVLLVSSHKGHPKSKKVPLRCLSDIGFGLWGLRLGDVLFD